MLQFAHIDVTQAKEKLSAGQAICVDIRDAQTREQGHIPASIHLTDENVETFLKSADRQHAVIVYCYHGNSSQMAAQYLIEQDFTEVYSMDGGYEAWAQQDS
ncbi:MAG: thiosulfate sulfurtransferase [Planctomycetota bacterium]|jgi:thiosulfate sulfurtransferase